MDKSELLLFILVDNLTANLVILTNKELAIWITPKLSDLNLILLLIVGFAAVILANILSYILGMTINRAFTATKQPTTTANIQLLTNLYNSFGYYLLALCFVPGIGKFIVLSAGFTRYNFLLSIFIASVSKLVYYIVNM